MPLRPLTALTLLVVLAIGVSACGRRSGLDTPSEARWEREREAAKAAGEPAPPKPTRDTPERPFILDSLID